MSIETNMIWKREFTYIIEPAMEKTDKPGTFIWRIASVHTIAYFIAGIFAINFLNYKEHYASESLSLLMRQVDSPWVALGPSLQLIRGIIIALVLLPFRSVFLRQNYGAAKLAWLMLGLSFISTIGPAPGSFEGYIYTVLPVQYHLLGIPETILYTVFFSWGALLWYRFGKSWFNVVSIIIVLLIILMSLAGYLRATGKI